MGSVGRLWRGRASRGRSSDGWSLGVVRRRTRRPDHLPYPWQQKPAHTHTCPISTSPLLHPLCIQLYEPRLSVHMHACCSRYTSSREAHDLRYFKTSSSSRLSASHFNQPPPSGAPKCCRRPLRSQTCGWIMMVIKWCAGKKLCVAACLRPLAILCFLHLALRACELRLLLKRGHLVRLVPH